MEEDTEKNEDLIAFLSSWLATALELEDKVAPVITQAFRIGSGKNPEMEISKRHNYHSSIYANETGNFKCSSEKGGGGETTRPTSLGVPQHCLRSYSEEKGT